MLEMELGHFASVTFLRIAKFTVEISTWNYFLIELWVRVSLLDTEDACTIAIQRRLTTVNKWISILWVNVVVVWAWERWIFCLMSTMRMKSNGKVVFGVIVLTAQCTGTQSTSTPDTCICEEFTIHESWLNYWSTRDDWRKRNVHVHWYEKTKSWANTHTACEHCTACTASNTLANTLPCTQRPKQTMYFSDDLCACTQYTNNEHEIKSEPKFNFVIDWFSIRLFLRTHTPTLVCQRRWQP